MGNLKNIAGYRLRVERSVVAANGDAVIAGVATIEEVDSGKMLIRVDGITFPPVVPLTFEHPKGVLNIVGEATLRVARAADDKPAIMFTGKLYTTRKPIAQELYDTALAMHEAGDNLSLFVSVEGDTPHADVVVHKTGDLAGVVELKSMALESLAITSSPFHKKAAWGPGEDWLPVAASLAAPEAFDVIRTVTHQDPEAGLRGLLAATFRLARSAQQAHWNVRGATFSQLHELFGEQYEDLNTAVDDLAERIRAINVMRAVSVGAGEVPFADFAPADEMVTELATQHESCAAQARLLAKVADGAGDAATVDLAGRRAVSHEKAAWMLRSTVPPAEVVAVQRSGIGYPTQAMGTTSQPGEELGVIVPGATSPRVDATNRSRDLAAFTLRLLTDYPHLGQDAAVEMTRELIARLTRRAPKE